MKCGRCGKFRLKTYKFYITDVCGKCLEELGFSPEDTMNPEYQYQPWDIISKGKAEADRLIDEKKRTKVLKINLGDVEDPKVERVLNGLKDGLFEYELFGGYTVEDLKEDLDEHQHHIYGGMDFDCEVKREGDKAIVLINGQKVAETEYKKEMDLGKSYLIVNGGKYRQVIDGRSCSGKDPYWLMLKVVYMI